MRNDSRSLNSNLLFHDGAGKFWSGTTEEAIAHGIPDVSTAPQYWGMFSAGIGGTLHAQSVPLHCMAGFV
jgi:hypothetical protein